MNLHPAPGTRAVVAGGCGGIGRAVVDALLRLELKVAVVDHPRALEHHAPPGTEFLAGGTARAQAGDDWFRSGVSGYVAGIPLGRMAEPEDVVGPILFLAGDGARYITGQVLHVNGGRITP